MAKTLTAKQLAKVVDDRINAAYKVVGDGVQISIMDLPKMDAVCRQAIADGQTDAQLRETLAKWLAGHRKN